MLRFCVALGGSGHGSGLWRGLTALPVRKASGQAFWIAIERLLAMGAAAEVQRCSVAFDTDRDVERLLAQAGGTDDDVAAPIEVGVRVGEEPGQAALAAEVQLAALVLVVGCGFAADAQPHERTAAVRTDH
jgi:hypothetical protein